jgi:hypothetical protein
MELKITDLSDSSREHISKLISEGFREGEVVEVGADDEEFYGWWSLEKGRVLVTMPEDFVIIN